MAQKWNEAKNEPRTENFPLTRWLSEPAGIGRFDGEQGSRSRGEPLSGDVDLPSPRLCQTRALGHEIAIA